MFLMTATVEGESELRAAWGQVYGTVKRAASTGVTRGVREGAAEIRARHTFRNRTGTLERSVEGFAVGWVSEERFEGRIRAGASYASFVEEPTRPHEIRVRRAVWLRWEDSGGDVHFAKRVRHPGTRGQPFMHLGYFKCEAVIIREIEIGIARAERLLAA